MSKAIPSINLKSSVNVIRSKHRSDTIIITKKSNHHNESDDTDNSLKVLKKNKVKKEPIDTINTIQPTDTKPQKLKAIKTKKIINTPDENNTDSDVYESIDIHIDDKKSKDNVRTILSFDVGIINLAYCVLEVNCTTNIFKIIKWGIINLTSGRATCCHNKKNKKDELCDKVANRELKVNKINSYYYCAAHASKAKLDVRPIDMKWLNVNASSVRSCEMCKKPGEYFSDFFEGQYCKTHHRTITSVHKLKCTTKKCNNLVNQGIFLKKTSDENINNECDAIKYGYEFGWCDEHFEKEYVDYLMNKTKKILTKYHI
jgi:hypothetical protein